MPPRSSLSRSPVRRRRKRRPATRARAAMPPLPDRGIPRQRKRRLAPGAATRSTAQVQSQWMMKQQPAKGGARQPVLVHLRSNCSAAPALATTRKGEWESSYSKRIGSTICSTPRLWSPSACVRVTASIKEARPIHIDDPYPDRVAPPSSGSAHRRSRLVRCRRTSGRSPGSRERRERDVLCWARAPGDVRGPL